MSYKKSVLQTIYQNHPFSLKANLNSLPLSKNGLISCLIVSSRGSEYLNPLLQDLDQQSLSKDEFEIIVLNEASSHGFIGKMRNQTLEKSSGQYILFLDDDTRIPQKSFLEDALRLFKKTNAQCIMPQAQGLAPLGKPHYSYLDSYSMATRCCLYQRNSIEELGGFRDDIKAYEDIELGIRFHLWGGTTLKTNVLYYQHPALYFNSLQKPLAIGQSILKLRQYYPLMMWLLIYLNALRFLPLILIPTTKNRQWFKISLGVLLAPWTKKQYSY